MKTGTQSKLIEIISKKPLGPTDLARKLQITPQALHRQLRLLCQRGVLAKTGKAPHVRYELTRTPLPFNSRQQKILSEIASILGAHPAIPMVTLFGSVARGQAGPESDIDLLVWLDPDEPFDRRDIWEYWDRQSRHLEWAKKVSIVTQRMLPRLNVHTLLLDLPEEHLVLVDKKGYFAKLRQAILDWRRRNGAVKMPSFGGTHGWKYSTKAKSLDEINFEIEVGNVA